MITQKFTRIVLLAVASSSILLVSATPNAIGAKCASNAKLVKIKGKPTCLVTKSKNSAVAAKPKKTATSSKSKVGTTKSIKKVVKRKHITLPKLPKNQKFKPNVNTSYSGGMQEVNQDTALAQKKAAKEAAKISPKSIPTPKSNLPANLVISCKRGSVTLHLEANSKCPQGFTAK